MCCVDKKNWKFGGMDLTTATVVMGVVLTIKAIGCLVLSGFTEFFSLALGITMICVLCQPHSLCLRKAIVIMFWIEVILLFLTIVWYVVLIVAVASIYDCDDDINCDQIKTFTYILMGI